MRIHLFLILLQISITPKLSLAQHVVETAASLVSIPAKALRNCTNANKICYELRLTRRQVDEIALLQLPPDLVDTYAYLYREADYYKYQNNATELDYKVKRHDVREAKHQQPVTINMSGLENGTYLLSPVVVSIDTHVIFQNDTSGKLSIRRNRNQPVFALVPRGGTLSYVGLYTVEGYRNLHLQRRLEETALRFDGKAILEGQQPIIDLTSLQDDNYILIYQSCAFYSRIELTLATQ